jgi:hypothetical protein
MANDMLQTARDVQKAADLLTESADEMKQRRRKAFDNGELGAEQVMTNVAEEATLRENASLLLVKAIDFVLVGAQAPQADLEKAIKEANAKIAKMEQIKRALQIFAALITLGGAIVTGKPQAIVGAVKGLKEASAEQQ